MPRHRRRQSRTASSSPCLTEKLEDRCLLAAVSLAAAKDNTLFQEPNLSNGAGEWLYAGKTAARANRVLRRAALQFDIATDIPAGSTINSVSLDLVLSLAPRNVSTNTNMTMHRVLADWGEGSSDSGSPGGDGTSATAGDLTWTDTFLNQSNWTTPGGDYVSTASATASVGILGGTTVSWAGAGMVADVQHWVDNPSENFGWMLLGDESRNKTARRFTSRENTVGWEPPALVIDFTPPANVPDVTLAIDEANISEAGGMTTVTASIPDPATAEVIVELAWSGTATRGTDYSDTGSTITIGVGQRDGSVQITASDETLYEDDETIVVDIDSVTGANESTTQQVTTTIDNDDARPEVDIDGNANNDALTDGLLVLRHLFGFTGTTLTENAIGAGSTRSDPAEISTYLDTTVVSMLDPDASNDADALTDGLLFLRYLFEFSGSTLTDNALGGTATRTAPAEIIAFLDSFTSGGTTLPPGFVFAPPERDQDGRPTVSAITRNLSRPIEDIPSAAVVDESDSWSDAGRADFPAAAEVIDAYAIDQDSDLILPALPSLSGAA